SEAMQQYDAGIALDPLAPIPHFAKGLALQYQSKPEAALAEYDEALRLAPHLFNALFSKFLVLAELHRFDQADVLAGELPPVQSEMIKSFVAGLKDATRTDAAVAQIMAHGPGGIVFKPVM